MSAESPVRAQTKSGAGSSVVLPQQVTDLTILESVAGFINDVVPTTYNLPSDSKDQIQWARFENLTNEDLYSNPNGTEADKVLPPPLLLVLGYTTGIQIWAVPANGEATEILSWRHGAVRVLRILPAPNNRGCDTVDTYASKRPLIALCDNVTPGTDYCSLCFISLKTSEQVKLIKFKNPILDVVANQRSIVVTFSERIAVFDAFTLEDRLTITTCYLSPGIYPNPVALGTRWLAYAENKLIPSRRSSGGNDGEGVQSYTATVLHAAKSLGRGLRELGETVASSLTGNVPHKPGSIISGQTCGQNDVQQKGVVTILDIENNSINNAEKNIVTEAIVAHFTAHKEAIVCLSFDYSGLLLLTADKRGHDFHLFRIHPHPGGPTLAAVHHLYVLHRGDTTARVQDMCFSPDSRWVTVSTLRGTTHVFPVTPYGGNVGVRTHATPHVVNKMSRFHRSAGLTAEGRSNSPVSIFEAPVNSNLPYHNPRLPPYPHPTVVQPLAQIRQPLFAQNSSTQQRPSAGRQRLGSSSEDNIQVAMRVCACFASARAYLDPITQTREPQIMKPQVKPVESLFIMSLHGTLIQYDLEPHHSTSVPKEKVCDDTLIELSVCAKAQWILQRQSGGRDIQLPLSGENLGIIYREELPYKTKKPNHTDDRWLSQVEIVTHAGPHRRLWMGPQFTFKTYNNGTGASLNILEAQSIDVVRSKPVNMPLNAAYPILIEAGSVSSCEPSPKLLDNLQRNFEEVGGAGELQLKEDLAEAMLESPGVRDVGGRCVIVSMKHQHQHNTSVAKVVNPLGMVVTVQSDDEGELEPPEEVIHENCDEALFRPVVASKAVVFAEPRNVQTKVPRSVLHINKSVDVKKCDSTIKSEKGKVREESSKIRKNEEEVEVKKTLGKNRNKSREEISGGEDSEIERRLLKEQKLKQESEVKTEFRKENEVRKLKEETAGRKPREEKIKQEMLKEDCEVKKLKEDCDLRKCKGVVDDTKYKEDVDIKKLKEDSEVRKVESEDRKLKEDEVWKSKEEVRNEKKTKGDFEVKKYRQESEMRKEIESKKDFEERKSKEESDVKKPKDEIEPKEEISVSKKSSNSTKSASKIKSKTQATDLVKIDDEEKKKIKTKSENQKKSGKIKIVDAPSFDEDSIKTEQAISLIDKKEATINTLLDPFYDAQTYEDFDVDKTELFAKQEYESDKLEGISVSNKVDVFESAFFDAPLDRKEKEDSVEKTVSSSEEILSEEKQVVKKVRKPKAKLGVRIGSLNKNVASGEKKPAEDVLCKISPDCEGNTNDLSPPLPSPPATTTIRSWSSIAAQKPPEKILDLPELEPVPTDYSSKLKGFSLDEAQAEAEDDTKEILEPEKSWHETTKPDEDLLKLDKSSDDEKVENNSSQTETTESDDSSKRLLVINMDTEEDLQSEIKPKTSANKSKKQKKKRR